MGYAIYGRGGFGREIAPLALEQAAREEGDVVFVDDTTDGQTECNGLPLLDFNELCMPAHRDRVIIVAIGDGKIRKKIEDKCRTAGLQMGILFAPTARTVGPSTFGEGTVLCDHSYITANARIGLSFQCNAFSYVAHDCVLGDYVSFAPRVSCNGNVHIGDFAYIGTGALIKQGTSSVPLTIGEGAIVGMGAVVTKNVDPYTVVVGNPARVLRKQEQ